MVEAAVVGLQAGENPREPTLSVINKVLRDLDQRTTPSPSATGSAGVRSVPQRSTARAATRLTPLLWCGMALGLVLALLAAWTWYPQSLPNEAKPTEVAVTAPPPVATVTVAAVPTPPPAAPPTAVESTPSVAVDGLRWEDRISASRALDALVSVPASTKAPSPVAVEKSAIPATPTLTAALPRSTTSVPNAPALNLVPTPVPSPKSTQQGTTAPSNTIVQRQQLAAEDALASAQNLWNAGSRSTALETLQQAIDTAERASSPLLLTLAREMARMQLADGRYGEVWDLLTRLEPHLGSQADLWAIRANAAQRLGRHQDSVHAYLIALKTRPDEQRWLLGTAVSLAALGKSASATEMAEKARAVGPINKDIAAYLRQAGVAFRD